MRISCCPTDAFPPPREVAEALNYLHTSNPPMLHRDLKGAAARWLPHPRSSKDSSVKQWNRAGAWGWNSHCPTMCKSAILGSLTKSPRTKFPNLPIFMEFNRNTICPRRTAGNEECERLKNCFFLGPTSKPRVNTTLQQEPQKSNNVAPFPEYFLVFCSCSEPAGYILHANCGNAILI